MAQPKQNIWTRFWRYVDRSDGCWMWRGGRSSRGYGKIKIDGKNRLAHRIAWELENGPVPAGLVVMHTCDTPGCVNPRHLVAGTQSQNIRDSFAKGRKATGFEHPQATLTDAQGREIRLLYGHGTKLGELAKRYRVSDRTVLNIVHGIGRWERVA